MAEAGDDKPFSGQLALVTGASRGIGAATALALAAKGAHVILTARDAKKLEAIEDAIFEAGGSATIAPVDLAEPDGVARLIAALASRWQALDIVVLSAAHFPQLVSVTQLDPRELTKTLTLNVMAQQALLAHCDPMLRLCAGSARDLEDPRRNRRSRRDPHRDARAGLSGRGPGQCEAARNGRRADCRSGRRTVRNWASRAR